MNRLRGHLTYANVVSTLCLFLLLGGGAAVAVTTVLPKNSVGAKQLKAGAVTPVKLSTASKASLTGPQGPPGAVGPKGAPGQPGESGLPSVLPSGRTEKGSYGFASTRFEGAGAVFSPGFQVSYPIPLSFSPAINFIGEGGAATANCPGSVDDPTATAGNLCIYAGREDVGVSIENVPASGKFGFLMFSEAVEGQNYEEFGSWAVTAP
jgi:hypothetical protein